jgi:DNA polymerase III delta prime subunit
MFVGIPSIGKLGVAFELAEKLLCQAPTQSEKVGNNSSASLNSCGVCKACTLTRSFNHPDLHEITFGGEDGATVDGLREMLDQLNLTAFLGGRKVAILNNAENLSIVGSNILLKSLEEPRPDTYFIVITSNATRLPATLLSRCQRWFFDKLNPADIKRILSDLPDSTTEKTSLLLAEGSFASIETMRERPGMWDDVEEALDAAFAGQDARVLHIAQSWATEKDSLRERLVLLAASAQRRLHAHAQHPEHAAVWALALQNLLDAEYLLLERHVSPLLVLLAALRPLIERLSR